MTAEREKRQEDDDAPDTVNAFMSRWLVGSMVGEIFPGVHTLKIERKGRTGSEHR